MNQARGDFRLVLGVAAVSLGVRICNLGTFSLWLDEILLVERSRGAIVQAWQASVANAEHPPLTAILMSLGYSAGLGDTAQRLLPIAAGVLTVVLLTLWISRHLGVRTGAIAGLLAALSPLHLRYSQELRPYSLLLLLAVGTLVAVDRLRERPSWSSTALLAGVVAAGLYTHLQYPLVLLPAGIMLLLPAERNGDYGPSKRTAAVHAAVALGLALLAFLPWLRVLSTLAERPSLGGAVAWTWAEIAKRWQFLTVAAREGDAFTWGGALMFAIVIVGMVVLLRRRIGIASLVGILSGTVGIELLLIAEDHWSNGRYNLIAWPFLMVVIAAGLDWLLRGRRLVIGIPVAAALLWAHVGAIGEYQRIGRPSWDRLAQAIEHVRRPGEPVLTENLQCWVSLDYYLRGAGRGTSSGDPPAPRNLDGDLAALRSACEVAGSCLVVTGRLPAYSELRGLTSGSPKIVEYWSTAALHRISVDTSWPMNGWPEPSTVSLPPELRGQPPDCLTRLWRALAGPPHQRGAIRLDFDEASTRGVLLSGWSVFERSGDGTTFVWATGHEASLTVPLGLQNRACLATRLWPMACGEDDQRARFLLGDHELGEVQIPPGGGVVQLEVPDRALYRSGGLLVVQFGSTCAPRDLDAASSDARQLAAAFDWLELKPGPCGEAPR